MGTRRRPQSLGGEGQKCGHVKRGRTFINNPNYMRVLSPREILKILGNFPETKYYKCMKTLLLLVLALSGCATTPLSERGSTVTLVTALSAQDLKELRLLGNVSCKARGHTDPEVNIQSCKNDLRNQAANLGASIVVLESQQLGNSWCSGCILMTGSAYRK